MGEEKGSDKTEPEQKRCFVISPIGADGSSERDHADWLFEMIIEPVLTNDFPGQFKLIRADKIADPGMIDAQIIEHLLDDELVIADMTGQNPNAFYEIGIRHMIEKPIVHMIRKGEKIPFDVAPFRTAFFDYKHPSELRDARQELQSAVEAVLAPDHTVDTPITRTRGLIRLRESASPEVSILMTQFAAIRKRLDQLEGIASQYRARSPSDLFASLQNKETSDPSTTVTVEVSPQNRAAREQLANYIANILELAGPSASWNWEGSELKVHIPNEVTADAKRVVIRALAAMPGVMNIAE